jgi:UDP-N-acetylmuramate dehydrogenase
MELRHNTSLKPFNTFGIDIPAEHFTELHTTEQLQELTELPFERYILGGGSNVLLTNPVAGLVIQNKLRGIKVVKEDDEHVWVEAASGEVWHDLVMKAIENGWAGIENLALIPGTVGASPMQNIGAYGVEAKQTIASVTAWHWDERTFITYSNAECQFGYRDSIFKHQLKGKVLITSVVYKLNKKPKFNISYGAIEQQLVAQGIEQLSIKAIAEAVIAIRQSKLPDPKQIGNAGSFFKNPTIPKANYEALQAEFKYIPSYPVDNQTVKVPAGWLIEQCGWKGYRKDDYGVHAKQALVLVNYGNAHGNDIWELSSQIVDSVKTKYDIELEREVQVW